MKTLIYTNAYGPDINFAMALQMVTQLRATGYDRDVILLSDRKYEFPVELHARTIVIDTAESMPLFKAMLPADIAAQYDAVLYVDTDVYFNKHPDAIFSLLKDRMLLPRTHFRLCRASYNLGALTEQEQRLISAGGLIDPESRSINAGVILFPGDQYATICGIWKILWAESKPANQPKFGIQRDQQPLQAMLVRKVVKYDYFPENVVIFPKAEPRFPATEDTAIAHFVGYSYTDARKNDCLNAIKAYPEVLAKAKEMAAKAAAPSPEEQA